MTLKKVLIAGGGIGGLAAALALLRAGIDVEVYEQSSELREVGAGIQISPNGNRVLDHLGVLQNLQALSSPTDGKEIRLWNTGQMWKLFDLGDAAVKKYGYPYMTAFRPALLQVLADGVRAGLHGGVDIGFAGEAAHLDAGALNGHGNQSKGGVVSGSPHCAS